MLAAFKSAYIVAAEYNTYYLFTNFKIVLHITLQRIYMKYIQHNYVHKGIIKIELMLMSSALYFSQK